MRVRFLSLGCRVNQYEAQALEGLFSQNGFTVVMDGEADVFVINSCTVTSAADHKSCLLYTSSFCSQRARGRSSA